MKYRPDIDGLRALAVAAVVLYHARLGCSGGYLGVDIFFVISGYLITHMLRKQVGEGRFRVASFWSRRFRRLAPALAVMLAANCLAGALLLLPDDLVGLGKALVAQPLLLANFVSRSTVRFGYFGNAPESHPLLHTWSLAIEEQFYLFLPVICLAVFQPRRQLKTAAWVLGTMLVLSLAASIYFTPRRPAFAFFLLPSRMWELLVGSTVSLFDGLRLSGMVAEWLSGLAITLVAACVFLFSERTQVPGFAAILPVASTGVLILCSSARQTRVSRLLSRPLFVNLGKMSYSVYLWHWPLFAYARYTNCGPLPLVVKWVLLGLSLLLGWVSWRWIETPFRVGPALASRSRTLVAAALLAAGSISTGLVFIRTGGFRGFWPEQSLVYYSARDQRVVYGQQYDGPIVRPIGDLAQDSTALLIWGDSHSISLAPVLDQLGRARHFRIQQCAWPATPPLTYPQDAVGWAQRVFDIVEKSRVKVTVLAAAWSNYAQDDFEVRLLETVRSLKKRGTQVYIVRDVPVHEVDVPGFLARDFRWGLGLGVTGLLREDYRARNRQVEKSFAVLAGEVTFIDPTEVLIDGSGVCLAKKGTQALYCDEGHLTAFGSEQLAPIFSPLFAKLESGRKSGQGKK